MVTFVREVGEECVERGIVTAAAAAAKTRTCGILMFRMPELTGILSSLAALSSFYNSILSRINVNFSKRYIVLRCYPAGINLIVD